jgi:hypothetical protein
MGYSIFDAIRGDTHTWSRFVNGVFVWGVDLNSSAFSPFGYSFQGKLYGRSYDQTFDTWDDYANWRTEVASLPSSRIYSAFMVIAKNQGFDPNGSQEMGYRNGALVYAVWVDDCKAGEGCTVAKDNLDGFWKDPITWFHHGNPSWYQGFLFDTPHLVGGDPMSAHIDPFGPLNPFHYLIQLPSMLFGSGAPGTATCAVNGGCTIH